MKMVPGWSDADAETVAALHQTWNARLRVVPGVGCPPATPSSNPSSVSMPYIAGKSLSSLLRAGADTGGIVHRAGRALAALHVELPDEDPLANLSSMRRRLALSSGPVRAVKPVRSVVDFTPYNMIVDDCETLHIIDVEPDRPAVTLHADLAWFLGWYGEYGGKDPGAFLSGYERQCGQPLLRDDERILATFLARFHALRAGRQLRRHNWSAAGKAIAKARNEWSRAR